MVLVPPPGAGHNVLLLDGVGAANAVSGVDIVLGDGSPALPQNAAFASGAYKPTA